MTTEEGRGASAARGGGGAGGVMAPTGERTSRKAVLSAGLGLLAVVAPPLSLLSVMYMTGFPPQIGVIAVPAAIAAVVLGLLARRDIQGRARTGTGLSLAGTILGVVALLIHVLPMAMPALLLIGLGADG